MAPPETSVIIRTFNEERHLPGLLQSLDEQSYRDFEIVVVDSGSLDRTREIAGARADKLLRIHSSDFTFGFSLNVGIEAAVGEFVVIVSAHTLAVGDTWLSALVEPLSDEQTAMVYGRQLGGPTSKFGEDQDLRRTFGTERRVLRAPHYFANNANSAIRRELWTTHPFDETLPGLEDVAWAKYWMERGYAVVYEPKAVLRHIHEEAWPQVQRRYYREAMAAKGLGLKGRTNIPLEVLREGKHLIGDIAAAAMRGHLPKKSYEIGMFRFHKSVGTVRGLWDGTAMQDPRKRQSLYFDRRCQAVLIDKPGHAALVDIELPPVKPGDVVIKVAYVGVSPIDLQVYDGTMSINGTLARLPIVPGHEFSGKVVHVGSNVDHLKEGDLVVAERSLGCEQCHYCRQGYRIGCDQHKEVGIIGLNGAYSEYLVMPGRYVHKLPDGTDLRKACLCEPLAVALKGLKRLGGVSSLEETSRFAVVGGNPLGHLCARILASRGLGMTVFDDSPIRRDDLDGNVVPTGDDLGELSEYDVIVEATGSPQTLNEILLRSRPGAALLLLGLPSSREEVDLGNLVVYDKIIVGSVGGGPDDIRRAIEILPELQLDPFIENTLPLKEFRQGWDSFRAKDHMKILLEVDGQLGE